MTSVIIVSRSFSICSIFTFSFPTTCHLWQVEFDSELAPVIGTTRCVRGFPRQLFPRWIVQFTLDKTLDATFAKCITQAYVLSSATNRVNGMEVASYLDIHGFGQIFRQTGPVAPLLFSVHPKRVCSSRLLDFRSDGYRHRRSRHSL